MTSQPKILLSLLFAIILAGCVAPTAPTLRSIDNPIPPTPGGVYDISKVSMQPMPKFQARPVYPPEMRRAGVGGEGTILFTVKSDGTVADAMITKATNIQFGEAALQSILKWRFKPAEVDGQPVNCRLMVPIVFSLNNE